MKSLHFIGADFLRVISFKKKIYIYIYILLNNKLGKL